MHQARILAKSGYKQKEIAELLGVSDRMVRKYLRPDYQPKTRPKRPSQLDPFKQDILSILQDRPFFNLNVLAKRLRKQGYNGGMTILRTYAAQIRSELLTKAVLRFETEPGRQAQVDWKECGRWIVDGKAQKVYAFVMILGYSRKPFVLFTSSMSSPLLLAAHNEAFSHFGGVPQEILYDNMKTAWQARGSEWVVNTSLQLYAAQVGFEPKRCQVRRPQTKGKVERFIGYLGNNFLPMARSKGLRSIEELNGNIASWLDEVNQEELRDFCQTRNERFDIEKQHLSPWIAQAAPDIRINHEAVVSREGFVTYETNRYSVPAEYIGKSVTLRIHPLTKLVEFLVKDKILYSRTLETAGQRSKVQRAEDLRSLEKRWEKENRSPRIIKLANPQENDPVEAKTKSIEVEVRSPKSYEVYVGTSA